jgi:hypothetical protein
VVTAPRIAKRRDVIDVDPEAQMTNFRQVIVPQQGRTGARLVVVPAPS